MGNQLTVQQERQQRVLRFKQNLAKLKDKGEMDMLPSSVSFDAFRNAAVVAVTDNPAILECAPESVFKAVRRLAAAGLVPDGREAAIVPFKGAAQAMPMVAGLIKTARNSGEITSIWADVVYENEELRVWIEDGERKFDHTYNPLSRGGSIVGAFAVAKLKDGTIEFEPMDRTQIERRRRASSNQKGPSPTGVWADWYDEMAKKTVIRALTKRLPVSSDDMRRIMVEQDEVAPLRDVTPEREAPRQNLASRLKDEEPTPVTGEIMNDDDPHWTATISLDDAFSGSEDFAVGAEAFASGIPATDCPHEGNEEKAADWLGGWHEAQKEGAGE